MNTHNLKIGDVVWRMIGHRRNTDAPVEWHAEPLCIERMDEHKFLSGHGGGGSWNSIGKTYFLTRDECLSYWDAHKHEYDNPAITSADMHRAPKLGSIVRDETTFYNGEDPLHVYVNGVPVNLDMLSWAINERNSEYGLPAEYITLGMIRERLGTDRIITVWHEESLRGSIYQTGNFPNESSWRLHGHTLGYA